MIFPKYISCYPMLLSLMYLNFSERTEFDLVQLKISRICIMSAAFLCGYNGFQQITSKSIESCCGKETGCVSDDMVTIPVIPFCLSDKKNVQNLIFERKNIKQVAFSWSGAYFVDNNGAVICNSPDADILGGNVAENTSDGGIKQICCGWSNTFCVTTNGQLYSLSGTKRSDYDFDQTATGDVERNRGYPMSKTKITNGFREG